MNRRPSRLVIGTLLAGLLVTSYWIGTSLATTGRSAYSIAEVKEILEEDRRMPWFVGEHNGFVFGKKVTAADLGCNGELDEATAEAVSTSPLNFVPTYLPKSMSVEEEYGYQCDAELVYIARVYRGTAGELTIVRSTGNTTLSVAPHQRMQTLEVAGRPAVT